HLTGLAELVKSYLAIAIWCRGDAIRATDVLGVGEVNLDDLCEARQFVHPLIAKNAPGQHDAGTVPAPCGPPKWATAGFKRARPATGAFLLARRSVAASLDLE